MAFPAGYGSEVSYGASRGLEEGLHLCLLTITATSTTMAGDQNNGHTKDTCWQFGSSAFTQEKALLRSNAPKAFWTVKQTLTGRLLLPVHIHRSFIIQALSVLSVMPRLDAQKLREGCFAWGWDLRDHLVQFPHCVDKEALLLICCQITFSSDHLILVFISLSLSTQS